MLALGDKLILLIYNAFLKRIIIGVNDNRRAWDMEDAFVAIDEKPRWDSHGDPGICTTTGYHISILSLQGPAPCNKAAMSKNTFAFAYCQLKS